MTTYGPVEINRTMIALRLDAIARGLQWAAIVYGWSAIRSGGEALDAKAARLGLEKYRPPGSL